MADLDLATILADGEYLKREGDTLVGEIPAAGGAGDANPVHVNVMDYGAVGDGVADDTVELQAAITAIAAGGHLTCPSDLVFKVSATLVVTRTALTDKVHIDLNGSRVLWAGGAAPVFQFNGGGSHPTQRGPIIANIEVDGATTATAGFHWTDAGRSHFHDIRVENVAGPAFHLRNFAAFSENLTFERVFVSACNGIARYDGATDTGGTGQSSFARQHWSNITGASAGTAWFHISAGALPYGSSFDHVKGNCGGTAAVAIFNVLGSMGGGTQVRNLDVEQAGAGSFLFNFNSVGGGTNPTLDMVSLRDGMQLVTGGTFANFGVINPAGQSFRLENDMPLMFTTATTAASTVGAIRLPNNRKISARNAAGSANLDLIVADGTDRVVIGAAAVAKTWLPSVEVEIDGIINHDGASVGFYGAAPVAQPSAVTARTALQSLGLGTALVADTASTTRTVTPYSGTAVTGVLGDAGAYLRFTGTNPTYTVPPNASVAFPVGTQIDGIGTATAMTIIQGSGVTITKARTLVTLGAGSGWTLIKTGTDTWDLHGDFV